MSNHLEFALKKLLERDNLSRSEASTVMGEIMGGTAHPAVLAAFLVGLRMKGETAEEIAGFASTMRSIGTKILTRHEDVVDTCGTGGDGSGSFNISTAAAIVTASAGLPVAKHGNRAVSSKSGSADVLEALGLRLDHDPASVGRILDDVGITFLFAQRLHPAMRHAAEVRKALATRTVFNILGPLTNPAGARAQVLGVFSPALTETMAEVLGILGSRRALVVHGEDGLDELSISGPSRVSEFANGLVRTYEVTPESAGLEKHDATDIRGGAAAENAEIIRGVLAGKKGAPRDIVVLNTAAALLAGGRVHDLKEGALLAKNSIDSSHARQTLDRWVQASNDIP